jgi:superfamily I DNA and/or RNA helicase
MLEQFAREAGGRNGRNGNTSIGVCALYPAQAELIRCLMRRSPILGGAAEHIRVGVPADFRERECHIALLSLTRSHSHRAVSFGGHPQDLVLALTRARSRLLVFGDQGTLARRTEWDGPVDHLDERSADRERKLLARLVRPQPSAPPTRALTRPQGSRP